MGTRSLFGDQHRGLQLGVHLAHRGDFGLAATDFRRRLGALDVTPFVAQRRAKRISDGRRALAWLPSFARWLHCQLAAMTELRLLW